MLTLKSEFPSNNENFLFNYLQIYEESERLNISPLKFHYGCFLSDLTGFANRTPVLISHQSI